MKPVHPIEAYIGITRFFTDLSPPCEGRVLRPKGFRVVELSEPLPGEEYVYLLLKENIDTLHAVAFLERKFRSPFSWAGLKDANAITVQAVSSPKRVEDLSARVGKGCLVLKRLGKGRVEFGVLRGNLFIIDLAFECNVEGYEMPESMTVPGFFGHQRFGSRRPISHVVGKFLLRGEQEKAADALLGEPFPWESERAREVRKRYYEEGPKAFLDAPKFMDLEKRVAKALLNGVPLEKVLRKLRLFRLFLHAFQSYIYNKALSAQENPCEGPKRLPGPGATEFSDILEEEGIDFDDLKKFKLRATPRAPCYKTKVKSFKRENYLTIIFELPKGYYATSLIREILKTSPVYF